MVARELLGICFWYYGWKGVAMASLGCCCWAIACGIMVVG